MTRVIDLRHYGHGSLPEGFKQMLIEVHAHSYANANHNTHSNRYAYSNVHGDTGQPQHKC